MFEYKRRTVLDVLGTFEEKPKNSGVFSYKNGDTNSLPLLLGSPEIFFSAFDHYFIQPSGLASKSYWLRDKNGNVSAAAGFSATLKDWGRLALHTLRILKGALGDCHRQFMNEATSTKVKNAAYGYDYGYQTWIHQRGPVFIWMGAYGQKAFVDKTNEKVLILFRNSEDNEFVAQVTRVYWSP